MREPNDQKAMFLVFSMIMSLNFLFSQLDDHLLLGLHKDFVNRLLTYTIHQSDKI
jgi:hypothetical protein